MGGLFIDGVCQLALMWFLNFASAMAFWVAGGRQDP